jgi:hypothetical protein
MLRGQDWTRAIGRAKIADAIKAYADNAQINTAQAKPSPRELTDIAREQGQGAIRELFSPEMGISQSPGALREEPLTGGPETRGPGDDTARPAAPAGGAGEPGVHTDTTDDFRKWAGTGQYPIPSTEINRRAAEYVVRNGVVTGHEYYAVFDPRTREVITAGTSNVPEMTAIHIPSGMVGDPAANLVLHHNHPQSRSLSAEDISLAGHPGVAWIVAHTHDGNVFGATLTADSRGLLDTGAEAARDYTIRGLENAWETAREAVGPSLKMQIKQGRITPEEAERLGTDLVMRALDAADIVHYVTTRSPEAHPLSSAVQDSILRRASEAARKAGIDNGILEDRPRSERYYRARTDRSALGVRPDEALATISGDAQQRLAGDVAGAGESGGGAELAGGATERTNALVGAGYLAERPVVIDRAAAQLNKIASSAKEVTRKLADELQLKVAPMAQGHWMARAITKDFANYERGAKYQRQAFDDAYLKYSDEDRARMWEAADAASTAAQVAGPEAIWEPLSKLPPDQIARLVEQDRYDAEVWERGKAAGLFTGDRIPFYTTRAMVQIDKEGRVSRVGETGEGATALDQLGINLVTRGIERRKYQTSEETEAAGKARFGPDTTLLRDIRVVPWAIERLEKAIATREMINKIKQMSPLLGKDAVISDGREGYFTLPHPAFNTYGPRLEVDQATGRWKASLDAEGNPILEKKPIWISNEFEGPLRSVLRSEDSPLYRAAMQVKQGATHAIMMSPVIHNMVEWGRAMPLMPGKVAGTRIYYEGNAMRRGIPYKNVLAHIADKLAGRQEDLVMNPEMREAIYDGGVVPGGHRGFLQDITGLAESPTLQAGRGLSAKILGGIGDVYSPELGTKIKQAIDKTGDLFHQTLLWDRIADLQMGIYKNFRDKLIDKDGFDRLTAVRTAGFFANRYAGFLPNEAMSQGARKLLNVILFSRSYKLGQAGIFKDIFTGLPRDLQAQILRDSGEVARASAVSYARSKAIRSFMIDVGMFYLGNAFLQTMTGLMFRDKDTADVERDYLGTLQRALNRIYEHPLDALNPIETLASFSPLFDNEPEKTDRIDWAKTQDGTELYLRSPVGKTGEELVGWIEHPLLMLRRGESTLARPLTNTFANDRGFGKKVYDPDAKGMSGVAANAGRVVWELLRSQVPEQQIAASYRMLTGDTREGDISQALLPFAGLTVSHGFPGGPEGGLIAQGKREQQFRTQEAQPAIDDKIRHGKIAEAVQDMTNLGIDPRLIRYRVRIIQDPSSRLSHRAIQEFMRSATPEQKGQLERMQGARPNP